MSDKPTVFVVDDDPGALRSLSWLIEQAEYPVRAYSSAREFLGSYDPSQTGFLLLDVKMPDMDGLEVQRQLAQRDSHLPIIFITAHGDVSTCASAFRSGAFHFLEKPVDDALLIDVIEEAVAFESNRLRLDAPHDFAGLAGELTPSEKEVMDMLIAGKSLKEIAAARDVTFQTASRHRLSILEKMGVDGDVALVRMATEWAYLQRRPQDA